MKMKALTLILVLCAIAYREGTIPTDLALFWAREGEKVPAVIDPDGILSVDERNRLYEAMSKHTKEFTTFLIVFNKPCEHYILPDGEVDLTKFTEELPVAFRLTKKESLKALFLVFVVESHVFMPKTGSYARKLIQKEKLRVLEAGMAPLLVGKKYEAAFSKLIEGLDPKRSSNQRIQDQYENKAEKTPIRDIFLIFVGVLAAAVLLASIPLLVFFGLFRKVFHRNSGETSPPTRYAGGTWIDSEMTGDQNMRANQGIKGTSEW